MRKPLYPSEYHGALQAQLLTLLQQGGPAFTGDLTASLNLSCFQVGWQLQRLAQDGLVRGQRKHVRLVIPGHGRVYRERTQWTWVSHSPMAGQTKTAKAERGITAEDHEWMAYWRQRRQDRQTQKERRHAV